MNPTLLSVLEVVGLVPTGAARARKARRWLDALASGPSLGDDFRGPERRASDEQLARLVPAVHAVLGIGEGGIRVVPTTDREMGEDSHRTTWPEGEATAAPELLYLLRRAYPDKEVQITGSSDLDENPGWQKCNLVVLGGPESNQVARAAWDRFGVRYSLKGHQLVDAKNEMLVEYRESAAEVMDAALVVRGPSPFVEDRVLVLMMGLETQGTCAAATSLECQEWLRLVAPCVRRLPSFIAVWEARCGVHDPWPNGGRFVAPIQSLSGESCPSDCSRPESASGMS